VGGCYFEFNRADFNLAWLDTSLRLEVWRAGAAGALTQIQTFFLLDFGSRIISNASGDERIIKVRGYDLNHVITRRIVTGAANSAAAAKTGPAANIMAAYVTEALLTAGDRDITDEFPLTLAYDPTAGATITYTASRGNLLSVLNGCANSSANRGTPMRFWVQPVLPNGGLLTIAAVPLGFDRREQLTLSPERGTLFNAEWEYKSAGTVNYAYIGGQGLREARDVAEVGGATGMQRREVWYENGNIPQGALDTLRDWGRARLWRQRARDLVGGEIRDTELTRFGLDWNLGDLVRGELDGLQADLEVDSVTAQILPDGGELLVGNLARYGEIE
jgi:hypothetical protein